MMCCLTYTNYNTMDKNLFEASLTGNVQALNALLEQDELILDRVSLNRLSETPLHIAALRGHVDFTKILLLKKPTLAMSLNSLRQTPLHVASAGGHVEIVRELLRVTGDEGCRFRDQDGRTPLYLAVKNEELEIIKLLIQTKADISRELQENGETVLHTCIAYNRFEAFKLLCQLWNEDELATLTDHNGNTLLHLAAVHKQVQTVKYLLQKPSIRMNVNAVNGHGFTALDVLDHCPRDIKALDLRTLLMEANFSRAKSFQTSIELFPSQNVTSHDNKPQGLMSRIWSWNLNNNGNWLEKQRAILMLATIIVATTSFYLGIHDTFNDFVAVYTIIMVISLMILVVLLSGIPLRNKFCLWVLNLATLCIIFLATVSYLHEIANMSPDSWVNPITLYMCFVWIVMCLLFGFIHTIFFIIWVVKKLMKARTRAKNNDQINGV